MLGERQGTEGNVPIREEREEEAGGRGGTGGECPVQPGHAAWDSGQDSLSGPALTAGSSLRDLHFPSPWSGWQRLCQRTSSDEMKGKSDLPLIGLTAGN